MARSYNCPNCGNVAASAWRMLGPMRRFQCAHCSARISTQGWLNWVSSVAIAFLVPLGGVFALIAIGEFSGPFLLPMLVATFIIGAVLACAPVLLAYLWFAKLVPR